MNPTGTQLSSLEHDSATPHRRVVDPVEALTTATDDGPDASNASPGPDGQQLEVTAGQVAIAVAQQASTGELTLVPAPAPEAVASLDLPAVELEAPDLGLSTVVRLSIKRALDVLLSLTCLVLLAPAMILIAALIKLGDGGPIFFAQRRVGLRGQTFRMLKFRSMVIHAERLRPKLQLCNESNGPVFKMRRDPRVTAIGRFIRRYSLDELPQLLNILRGDMSVVGPRPSLPSEVLSYQEWQFRRFAVRPGLTCFWQVSPDRYEASFDEWMRVDLKYVDEWNLRLDVELILRTFRVVLGGTGQ
jgi:lipopolysaccharide/colanic/teichoic acid biosynthesis glycosyltransferase